MIMKRYIALSAYWFRYCISYSPPKFQSFVDHCSFNANFFCPTEHPHCPPVVSEEKPSSIPSLLACGRPLTVARAIVLIVINSINGHARWSLPHICNKISDRVAPSFTNGNPATSVSFIIFCPWLITPSHHICPD